MHGSDDRGAGRFLAHSRHPASPEQTYEEHVKNVRDAAVTNALAASEYFSGDRAGFVQAVEAGALYHDLGKLDQANQSTLSTSGRAKLPLPHEDAGVAALLRQNRFEAAVLAGAHHAGLFSAVEEQKKRKWLLRDLRERTIQGRDVVVAEHTDANLEHYLRSHVEAGLPILPETPKQQIHRCGFMRRLALSCVVDADHGDTARHRGNEVRIKALPTRWVERSAALDAYVKRLPQRSSRDALRLQVYESCRDADTDVPVKTCDAPVGSGKTTAVMANLLRAAATKGLRHIIVVLPYTSIIKQAVEVYRKALTLPGENPEDIVAEHHHRADFGSAELRQLASLWRAPVVVTTAVQFFETIGAAHAAQLRKLHELPGSAVFVDETHTALPSPLWPQVWCWLQTLASEWSGYLLLASGSLPRFWELEEFVDEPAVVPDLLPDILRRQLIEDEGERIHYVAVDRPLNPAELVDFVMEKPGPRLLIMNTVQSAACVADAMRKRGEDVMHLSTALAPVHRDRVVERAKERLKYSYHDWTLVATSCVEAGMDFSFRSGFRERATTASLIQVGGRVNRGAEYGEAVVWDFRAEGGLLTQNPSLELPRKVVQRMFESGQMHNLSPGELAKQAMRGELTEKGKQDADELRKAEQQMDYPRVDTLCRVITTDTRVVVISDSLAKRIRGRERVGSRELLLHSVQMWTQKVKRSVLPIDLLMGSADEPDALYVWKAEYDPDFLGYMAGVLPILEVIQEGIFIV